MTHLENKNNEVRIRYQTKKVSGRDWDEIYSQLNGYKAMNFEKLSSGKVKSVNIIFRVPLTQEWIDEYKQENAGRYKCNVCLDIGVINGQFCKCSLGILAKQYVK